MRPQVEARNTSIPIPENTHILVTGGSGFLGSNIVRTLLKKHPTWTVSILDRNSPPADLQLKSIVFAQADIASQASVDAAFAILPRTPDIVIHSAGIVPARETRYSKLDADWKRVEAVNINGTKHVLQAIRASGCRNVVYTSSCTVIIDDGIAEQHVLDPDHVSSWSLKACALRPSTIIGEGDIAVISILHDLIAKGETPYVVGDGYNIYDFMHIDNAVHAHLLAVENLLTTGTAAGKAMFISNQEPVYFWDFMAAIWAEFGHVPPHRVYIPASVAWLTGVIMELITWSTGAASTLDRGSVKDGIRTQYADNALAIELLGYIPPVSMKEGIQRSCADYKKHLAKQEELKNLKAS